LQIEEKPSGNMVVCFVGGISGGCPGIKDCSLYQARNQFVGNRYQHGNFSKTKSGTPAFAVEQFKSRVNSVRFRGSVAKSSSSSISQQSLDRPNANAFDSERSSSSLFRNLYRKLFSALKNIARASRLALLAFILGAVAALAMTVVPYANFAQFAYAAPSVLATASAAMDSKKSDMQLTVIGTIVGGAVLLLLKALRSRQIEKTTKKNVEDISVVRYDQMMEKQWKQEDQKKKEVQAKAATDTELMSILQKRMQEVGGGDDTAPAVDDDPETFELKDMIESLESMWKDDNQGSKKNKNDKSDDESTRMGSWGGTGSALLEPPSGQSNKKKQDGSGDETPEIPMETLNMLRKCWDASDSDSERK